MKSPIERRHQKDKRNIPLRGDGSEKPVEAKNHKWVNTNE